MSLVHDHFFRLKTTFANEGGNENRLYDTHVGLCSVLSRFWPDVLACLTVPPMSSYAEDMTAEDTVIERLAQADQVGLATVPDGQNRLTCIWAVVGNGLRASGTDPVRRVISISRR
jgi:hypothetical protein